MPHLAQILGVLRRVPSPEQGTSQRTRSNTPLAREERMGIVGAGEEGEKSAITVGNS
jgi:hypothetical protein